MQNSAIVKGSVFLGLVSGAGRYLNIRPQALAAYKNSALRKMSEGWSDVMRVSNESSGIYAVLNSTGPLLALEDSIFINRGMRMYDRIRAIVGAGISTSRAALAVETAQKNISFDPAGSVGFIILIATVTNIAVSLLSGRGDGLLPWYMRAVFIAIGISWILLKKGPTNR